MTERVEYRGRCLCGAAEAVIEPPGMSVGACHCDMCRKWAGGPQFMVECGEAASFSGDVGVYDSSAWAERGFCKRCGTHLFYRLKQQPFYAVPVGLFDVDIPWIFEQQIFIEEKPAFYKFANETKNMTGAEVFAQFAPSSG